MSVKVSVLLMEGCCPGVHDNFSIGTCISSSPFPVLTDVC